MKDVLSMLLTFLVAGAIAGSPGSVQSWIRTDASSSVQKSRSDDSVKPGADAPGFALSPLRGLVGLSGATAGLSSSAGSTPPTSSLQPPASAAIRVIGLADADADVESGQEALGSSRRFPWYDGQTDGVRRIDFPTAKKMSSGGWNFSWFNLSIFELLAWTVVLLVLGLLFYWFIRAYLNREKRAALSETGGAGLGRHASETARVEALPFQIKRGTADLLGEARRNYDQGNFGEAVIYLFSYQLIEMDKGQVIRLTKGKTNRQYMREIGPRRALRELVEQTMMVFEDVFFGDYKIRRDRFESCWKRLGEFDQLISQGVA